MNTTARLIRITAAVAAICVGLTAIAFGCSTAPDDDRDEVDEFIGAPPVDDDDPMFRHALPAEAIPADPSGRVGTVDEPHEDEPAPQPDPSVDQEAVSELRDQLRQKEQRLQQLEQQLASRPQGDEVQDQLRNKDQQIRQLEEELDKTRRQLQQAQQRPAEEEQIQPPDHIDDGREACFSCVRICPRDDDGQVNCSDDTDDVICGWGSHRSDAEQAARAARAQCESSLDMARQMPSYADIHGECPPASCR